MWVQWNMKFSISVKKLYFLINSREGFVELTEPAACYLGPVDKANRNIEHNGHKNFVLRLTHHGHCCHVDNGSHY